MAMADTVFDENREGVLSDANKPSAKAIGRRLWLAGGKAMMMCVYDLLMQRLKPHGKNHRHDNRLLEYAWDGIGTWQVQ